MLHVSKRSTTNKKSEKSLKSSLNCNKKRFSAVTATGIPSELQQPMSNFIPIRCDNRSIDLLLTDRDRPLLF